MDETVCYTLSSGSSRIYTQGRPSEHVKTTPFHVISGTCRSFTTRSIDIYCTQCTHPAHLRVPHPIGAPLRSKQRRQPDPAQPPDISYWRPRACLPWPACRQRRAVLCHTNSILYASPEMENYPSLKCRPSSMTTDKDRNDWNQK